MPVSTAPPGGSTSLPAFNLSDAVPVMLASLLLAGVLALTATVWYKLRRRRRRRDNPVSAPMPLNAGDTTRRTRRRHRPRNPTLADTTGLPPVRDGNPPSPAG